MFCAGLIYTCPFFCTRLHSFVKDVVSIVVDVLIRLFRSPHFIFRSMNFVTIGILESFQTGILNPVSTHFSRKLPHSGIIGLRLSTGPRISLRNSWLSRRFWHRFYASGTWHCNGDFYPLLRIIRRIGFFVYLPRSKYWLRIFWASCLTGTGSFFPGDKKWPEHNADLSHTYLIFIWRNSPPPSGPGLLHSRGL
jgi:hypothetical protein